MTSICGGVDRSIIEKFLCRPNGITSLTCPDWLIEPKKHAAVPETAWNLKKKSLFKKQKNMTRLLHCAGLHLCMSVYSSYLVYTTQGKINTKELVCFESKVTWLSPLLSCYRTRGEMRLEKYDSFQLHCNTQIHHLCAASLNEYLHCQAISKAVDLNNPESMTC